MGVFSTMTVYSVVEGNNADLIRHVAELYADADSRIADVTYGLSLIHI